MAFGLKYTHSFNQIKNYTVDQYKIEIYLEGYVGGEMELTLAKDSIKVSREGDLLQNVQPTTMSFSIKNTTEAQFKEFRTAAWGDYKVILIQDPNGTPMNKFVGYNQSEIYSEPYDQPPYDSALEFTDGLSHLDHVRWDASGVLHTGQKTIIEVLRLALNLLPSPLKIREFVNIYEDSILSATTDSMLNQITVASEVYKEQKQEGGDTIEAAFFANQVIKEILKPFNAHIYQWDGIWYIIRPQEYLDTTMLFREFNANVGTESTVTVDATGSFTSNKRTVTGVNGLSNELVLQAQSSNMEMEVPLNRVKVTYNQDNLEIVNSNLIKNGCWDILSIPNASLPSQSFPEFWTINGSDFTTYQAMNSHLGMIWYTFEPTSQETATTFNSGINMTYSKTGIIISTTDSLQFSFKFNMKWLINLKSSGTSSTSVAAFLNNNLFVRYEVQVKLGAYYLKGDPVAGYSWTTAVSRATFEKIGFFVTGSYTINHDGVHEIVTTLPNAPVSAIVDMDVIIYRPYSNFNTYVQTITTDYNVNFVHLYQRCFKLLYLPSEVAPVDELILYSEIDEDENLEEIEVLHGDGTNSVTVNSFRLTSGLITDTWNRRGVAETEGILQLLLLQLRDLRGDFKRKLSASVIGEFNAFNTIEDTTDVTTQYYINDYEWSVENNEWTLGLLELKTFLNLIATNVSIVGGVLQEESGDLTTNVIPPPSPPQNLMIAPSPTLLVDQTNLNGYI